MRQSAAQGYTDAIDFLKKITSVGYSGWGDYAMTSKCYSLYSVLDDNYELELLSHANQGNSYAAIILAHNFFYKEDFAKAIDFYNICLFSLNKDEKEMFFYGDGGYDRLLLEASSMLGYCYEHGLGVEANIKKALVYYEMIGGYAKQRDPEICAEVKSLIISYNNPLLNEFVNNCGAQLYDGFVPESHAIRPWDRIGVLYLKLSKLELAKELIFLHDVSRNVEYTVNPIGTPSDLWAGELYYKGITVERNYEKAFQIFSHIANDAVGPFGNEFVDIYPDIYADACYRLYECYAFGRGTQKDSAKSKYFFKQALTYGSSSALFDDQRRYEIINH